MNERQNAAFSFFLKKHLQWKLKKIEFFSFPTIFLRSKKERKKKTKMSCKSRIEIKMKTGYSKCNCYLVFRMSLLRFYFAVFFSISSTQRQHLKNVLLFLTHLDDRFKALSPQFECALSKFLLSTISSSTQR